MKTTRGERFEDARRSMPGNLSLRAVERLSGVPYAIIQALEDDNNDRGVSYKEIMKLAEFYNVSVDYLLCVTDTPTRDATTQAICQETGLSEKAVNRIRGYESLPRYDELPEIQKQKIQSSNMGDLAKKVYNGLRKGYLKSSERLVKTQNKLFEADGYREFIKELEEYLKSETLHKKAKDKLKTIPYSENMTGADIMQLASENEEEAKKFLKVLDMFKEEEKTKEKAEYKFYKLNQSFQKLIEGIVSKELEKEG